MRLLHSRHSCEGRGGCYGPTPGCREDSYSVGMVGLSRFEVGHNLALPCYNWQLPFPHVWLRGHPQHDHLWRPIVDLVETIGSSLSTSGSDTSSGAVVQLLLLPAGPAWPWGHLPSIPWLWWCVATQSQSDWGSIGPSQYCQLRHHQMRSSSASQILYAYYRTTSSIQCLYM